MIVSASYRTDIPAFYGEWFRRRLETGFATVANPYGGPDYRVSLAPEEVDGFVFWTRNAAPFGAALADVEARGLPYVVQFTVTGHPRAVEEAVIAPERAIEQIHGLAEHAGPRAAVWRYDPVLATDLTPPAWHRANFTRLAAALEGAVDEVVVSWATIYRKTARNVAAAARAHGFAWDDPAADAKRALIADLASIAREHGMALTLCAQPELLVPGAAPARCVDAARLSDVAGRPVRARKKGNRPGCECAASRDIGAYDTCPHGCAYCYANRNRALARRRYKAHDPAAEKLATGPR